MFNASDTDFLAIDKGKNMESLSVSVLFTNFLELKSPQGEIQERIFTDYVFLPAFTFPGKPRFLDNVLPHPSGTPILRHGLLTESGMYRTLFAIEVKTQVVIHLVSVGTDCKRTDFKYNLITAAGVYRTGRNHDLQSRFRLFVAHIFHIVARLVLSIGSLDVLKELRNVSIVPEADKCLGIMTGSTYIITLILTAELAILLNVELGSGMALDTHVSGTVITIIIIESYREVSVEFLYAILTHQFHALLVYECAIVDIQHVLSGLDQNADFHRNEVKHPGSIAHFVRKIAKFLHECSAPHAFKIYRFGSERIFDQL